MKKVAIFVVGLLLFASCKEEGVDNNDKEKGALQVTPTTLEFEAENAQEQTVTVVTDAKWSLTQSVDWLIIKKETDKFTVGVETNKVASARTGTITVKAGDAESVPVIVTQKAGTEIMPTLTVTPAKLDYSAVGTAQELQVSCNTGNWGTNVIGSWISVEKVVNIEGEPDKLIVNADQNWTSSPRTGSITFTGYNVSPFTVNITQRGRTAADWASDPNLQELRAFPGAEGHGANTTGGRGGRVIYVTNLNDAGEGSLRWAVSQSGTKIIMFKVAGRIQLKSGLAFGGSNGNNMTIAGQTAPGDGICLSEWSVTLSDARNTIVRYLRFRMGDTNNVEDDAFWGRYNTNTILDHCSMSWSVDECASFYQNTDFTMQWCILSEAMNFSKHVKGPHGYGGIWGGRRATYHHNLLAHHNSRNPALSPFTASPNETLIDLRNNVVYNWGANCGYGGGGGGTNIVNNYYKPTPATPASGGINDVVERIFSPGANESTGEFGLYYVSGNHMCNPDGSTNETVTKSNWLGIHSAKYIGDLRSDTEFNKGNVTTHTAQQAFELVIANAGASFRRDATDARVTNEARYGLTPVRASNFSGTQAGHVDSQDDVGGWDDYTAKGEVAPEDKDGDGMPDTWEDANGLNKDDPSDGATKTLTISKDNPAGTYTNVEVYLYWLLNKDKK